MNDEPLLFECAIAADYLAERGMDEAAAVLRNAAEVNMLEFCDGETFRRRIGEPFVRDGYLYATDAKIAIRIPTSRGNTPFESEFPDMAKVFQEFCREVPRHPRGWLRWPTKPLDVETIVEIQDGITCPICRGESSYWASGDQFPCIYCDRTGYVERWNHAALGKTVISGRYWRLISRLPDAWYREPAAEDEPVWFRFRFGDGLLMPIDPKQARANAEAVHAARMVAADSAAAPGFSSHTGGGG